MIVIRTYRGFERIEYKAYFSKDGTKLLVQQSSAIGNYEDSLNKPGSSYLWFGEYHHLNREEVQELINHLQCWLHTGHLS